MPLEASESSLWVAAVEKKPPERSGGGVVATWTSMSEWRRSSFQAPFSPPRLPRGARRSCFPGGARRDGTSRAPPSPHRWLPMAEL